MINKIKLYIEEEMKSLSAERKNLRDKIMIDISYSQSEALAALFELIIKYEKKKGITDQKIYDLITDMKNAMETRAEETTSPEKALLWISKMEEMQYVLQLIERSKTVDEDTDFTVL
ncbi:MAG: hypothetical protein ACOCWO_05795 [Candidatus Muiribacteriaceae bacterium]